jgi:type I restriction enzyme S subunit
LGDVVDYGKTEKAEPDEIADKSWVLELEDIEKDTSRLLARVTFAERKSKSTKNRFETGDVLYGKLRPYLNKLLIADQPGVCTTEIIPLRKSSHIDNRYLFYWLKHPTFLDYVTSVSHGLNMPRLGTEAGKAAPFILAPLAEQKRIADKLESVLGRVATCRARLDRVPALLKRFRQSVLAAAVSGKLTEEWRERNVSLIDAATSLADVESTKNGKLRVQKSDANLDALDLFEVPVKWSWVKNHQLVVDSNTAICAGPFGTIFKAKDFRSSGIPIIFLRHVAEGQYLTRKPGFMDKAVWKAQHQEYSVHGGELLVTKLGDPPGTACIYPQGIGVAMVTPDVMKMEVDQRVADPLYLMYFFNSPLCKDLVTQMAFGATRLRIDLTMFKNFPIPLPPRAEQQEIVRRVEALFAIADRIESRLATAQKTVERLTPATLAKAFRGELVPQDPNDEPASALLERLKPAEPASSATKTRRKRSATV